MHSHNVAVQLHFGSRITRWTVRSLFIASVVVCLLLPSHALADVMEQGLSYTCDTARQELRISTLSKSGGGQEDPFVQFEKDDGALWNVDSMNQAALPIIKACRIGQHKIWVVITVGCAVETGFSPMVSLYANADVSIGKKGEIRVEGGWLRGEAHHPFAEAEFFGSYCSTGPTLSFSEIVVGLAGTEGRMLTVNMK
jgi:hypothetical protein